MNKLIVSAGLAAVGAASVQGAPGLSGDANTKPWSVSATVRGFYDDNYATLPKQVFDPVKNAFVDARRGSYGFDIRPAASYRLQAEQTSASIAYAYDMRYYENRARNKADHSHEVNGALSHAFTPRYKLDVTDSFVIAQEPTLLEPGVLSAPLRSDGNNLRNTGKISFSADLIPDRLTVVAGYDNNFYDYQQEGPVSRSALLDRMEHLGTLGLRMEVLRGTVALAGYQFGEVDYSSKDPIGFNLAGKPLASDLRDNQSHYGYVGVDQTFNPKLSASARVGVQHTEYVHADRLPGMQKSSTSPYVDANATWRYTTGSYAQLGVRHSRNQTDVGLLAGTTRTAATPTVDAESTTVYGSVNQKLIGRLTASLLAQYQHSEFKGGIANGLADSLGMVGIQFSYEINKFLSAEAGYNYDRLYSQIDRLGQPRSFTRNRVFVGIRANY